MAVTPWSGTIENGSCVWLAIRLFAWYMRYCIHDHMSTYHSLSYNFWMDWAWRLGTPNACVARMTLCLCFSPFCSGYQT